MFLCSLLAGPVPIHAVEVPLSRASFDRALEEGSRCRRYSDVTSYVVVRKGTESVLAAALEGVFQELFDDSIDQSFVTVRLATPYIQVAWKACEARLTGSPLDVEGLWNTIQASSTVTLEVQTRTSSTPNDAEARYDKEVLGIPPTASRLPGPGVTDVTLRRGAEGPVVQPVSVLAGVSHEFPATALQGEGPFFVLVRTEEPPLDLVLKLKRSALAKP
jgi:hypothetical protein